MKINILNRLFLMLGAVGLLTGLTGCQDLFTDPTKDKETGETVTLLLVDRNFIKTKFMVKLVDNATGEQLAGENI